MAVAPPLFTALIVFTALFMVCEFGESVTEQFERFHDKLCRQSWHLFPIDIQRMYLIFLGNSKQSMAISTFFSIASTRETLKKV